MKTKNLLQKTALMLALMLGYFSANANNVSITGTSVAGSNVTFNISWDNSWNTNLAPNNWDAVWVFVKYQDCATRLWAHAGLSTLAGDHTAASPLQVDPVTDGKGVFIRRSALGGGNISSTSITLKMTIPAGTYNYKVFGIEMVNVPQGAFDLGDGLSTSTFNSINITAASQSGGLTAAAIGGAAVAVPATFPMGYNAIYCMKYEITQEQYVEFLNALTYDQQKSRTLNDPISAAGTYALAAGFAYRNGIRISVPGNNSALPAVYACDATSGVENNANDGQNIACNNINWGDVAAYLDWSALRPMTDMEFEKICRGPVGRVAGEYPWGSTAIVPVYSSTTTSPLTATESYSPTANGLCVHAVGSTSTVYGPVRVGIFASGSSGRASAGATYYGVMEMGGNVWERIVTTGNATGVTFTGNNGDGTLDVIGEPNQTTWPSSTTATGSGFRGGDYYSAATVVRTSDRSSSATTNATRVYSYGGRGVR
ncbi:MAG TPA: SUMF1/EgtB/PvdO family nonheme iron enzyme [Bacteroidia bacterium]|jgi:formylglycine-generating enzyme required for sulfatase activity